MNAITKTLKHQEKSTFKKLKNKSFSTIESLITHPALIEVIKEELPSYRNRIYPPIQTLCMCSRRSIWTAAPVNMWTAA